MSLGNQYVSDVFNQLRPAFPIWFPDTLHKLGDYGPVRNGMFERLGNLTDDFNIEVQGNEGSAVSQIRYASSGSVNFNLRGKGEVSTLTDSINARAEIQFGKENAIFLSASGCQETRVVDKLHLGEKLIALDKEWTRAWVVVTDVISAQSTTVLISSESGAEAILEATANTETLDLADASIGLQLRSQKSLAFEMVSKGAPSPLVGLCKLKRAFVGLPSSIRSYSANAVTSAIGPDSDEADIDEFQFVQIT